MRRMGNARPEEEKTMIRAASVQDADALARIYNHYVLKSTATFEEQAITTPEMDRRIQEVRQGALPWLVAEEDGWVIGYAYASWWKDRSAYRFSVESTIYLEPGARGQGHGSPLYEALLSELRAKSIHSVIGIIALPNDASLALHEKLGFKKVAHLKEVGWKFEKRIDVGYWQLML